MRSLASAWLKSDHAKAHLQLLTAAADLFFQQGPAPFQFKQGDVGQGEWTIVRLHVVREPPPELSLIAGDVASNMRAALDHSIFGLSAAKKRSNYFPIASNREDYLSKQRDSMMEGVDDRFKDIVDRHQPFVALGDKHPLARLKSFNDADKHRVTHAGFTKPRLLNVTTTPPERVGDVEVRLPTFAGPVRDGDELCRFRRTGPDPTFKVRTTIAFAVGFGELAIDALEFGEIGTAIDGLLGEFKRAEYSVGHGRPGSSPAGSVPTPTSVSRRFVGGPIDRQSRDIDPRIGAVEPDRPVPAHYVLTRVHPPNSDVQYDPVSRGFYDPDRPETEFYFIWADTNWLDPRMPRHNVRWMLYDDGQVRG